MSSDAGATKARGVVDVLRLMVALLVTVLSVFALTACSREGDFAYEDAATPTNWKVGVSIPTSSLAIIDESTVERWVNIRDWTRTELVRHGFKSENVVLKSAASRGDQVKDLKNLVDSEKVDELVVVPVNYTKSELKSLNQVRADPASAYLERLNGSGNQSATTADSSSKDFGTSHEDEQDAEHSESIVDVLKNAKERGIFTVGIGFNDLDGFPFDYFAATISPEDVANVQAEFVVRHFGLPEIDEHGNLTAAPKDFKAHNVEVLIFDAAYSTTRRYFKQLWKQIGPYFHQGYFRSLSGALTQDTKDDDKSEQEVVEKLSIPNDGDKAAGVMHNVLDKFYKKDELNVVFAQFDALSRGAVRACAEDGLDSSSKKWPLIVGAGAERLSISDVVEGKQAITIAFDSKTLIQTLVQVLANEALRQPQLAKGQQNTLNEELQKAFDAKSGTLYLESVANKDGVVIPLIVARPVTIVQDNLKDFLVDKGYITDVYAGI